MALQLYTLTTPSHQTLLNQWFVPSIISEFDLHIEYYPQECPSGAFNEPGWTATTRRKVQLIIDAIERNWGEVIVYSDVDAQFIAEASAELRRAVEIFDIAFQRDDPYGNVCAGFFAVKCNDRSVALWKNVLLNMSTAEKVSDQPIVNRLLGNHFPVYWTYLPESFFGAGLYNGRPGYRWAEGDELVVPRNIVYHHANWCVGVSNKAAQLKLVRESFEGPKQSNLSV